jgi:hypothetical protein
VHRIRSRWSAAESAANAAAHRASPGFSAIAGVRPKLNPEDAYTNTAPAMNEKNPTTIHDSLTNLFSTTAFKKPSKNC